MNNNDFVAHNSPIELLQSAGFIAVQDGPLMDNFLIHYLPWNSAKLGYAEPLPSQTLFPWKNNPALEAKISLWSFSFLDCDLCKSEIKMLTELQNSATKPSNFMVMPIIAGTNATRLVVDFISPYAAINSLVFLDLEDGLAERTAVLHTPSLRLLDEDGRVFAYSNQAIDISNQSFINLLQLFKNWPKFREQKKLQAFSEVLQEPALFTPNSHLNRDKIGAMHLFLLGICVIVCYSIWWGYRRSK